MGFTENHFQSHDGLSLYYRSYGSGAHVVLCLPGLTRNSKDFHELATHLAPGYRVVCPDLRGRGQSDWDPVWHHYVPGTYIDDAWQLVEQLDFTSLVIIGTSLGGLMAMVMASQRPQQVTAIVLNDIGPEVDPVGYERVLASADSQFTATSWPEAIQLCRQAHAATFPDKPEDFWEGFTRQTYRESDDGRPEFEMDPNVFRVFTDAVPERIARAPVDLWDAFRAVSMPCLVLRGELSDFLSREIMERMVAVKPGLAQVLIPKRGHAPLLDEVESVTAIDWFLELLR